MNDRPEVEDMVQCFVASGKKLVPMHKGRVVEVCDGYWMVDRMEIHGGRPWICAERFVKKVGIMDELRDVVKKAVTDCDHILTGDQMEKVSASVILALIPIVSRMEEAEKLNVKMATAYNNALTDKNSEIQELKDEMRVRDGLMGDT